MHDDSSAFSSPLQGAAIASEPPTGTTDTIFALSSGSGVTAGVAIIRVSGPAVRFCVEKLLRVGETSVKFPRPRYATLRKIFHPSSEELLDECVVLYFPGPKSFTGDDIVEFHVHGSRAVIAGVVDALSYIDGFEGKPSIVRPAERGEFTRRAFENGKMDLTSVEGLADLISADTAMQRKQALQQLGGEVRRLLEQWREEIKSCLAHAEAVIDFGDDVDEDAFEAIVPRIRKLRDQLKTHLYDGGRGEIVRGGARVAIVGEPNAGKSTLLNALAKRPAAIVSPLAGTTRDIVEVHLDVDGMPVIVSDTAGLRDETHDPIEIEGMRRARDAASNADVTILVHDASNGRLEEAVASLPARLCLGKSESNTPTVNTQVICIANKVDLVPKQTFADSIRGVPVFRTSLLHNEGATEVINRLKEVLARQFLQSDRDRGSSAEHGHDGKNDAVPVITRARHRYHLSNAVSALDSFMAGRTGDDRDIYLPMDLAAEDLRIAGKELGAITGVIHAEEVLDVIFSEFCIGK